MHRKKMIPIFVLLTCGTLSYNAWGQSGASAQLPKLSKANPVASPNRTSFSALAGTSKIKVTSGKNTSGTVVVDSDGKTIGRVLPSVLGYGLMMMMSYNNQPMQVGPLLPDFDQHTGEMLSDGLILSTVPGPNVDPAVTTIFYLSSDCSGPPVILAQLIPGTRYAGIPVSDVWPPTRSSVYLLITDNSHPTFVTAQSFFQQGQCYTSPFQTWVAQVIGAAPASSIGTSPYYLK